MAIQYAWYTVECVIEVTCLRVRRCSSESILSYGASLASRSGLVNLGECLVFISSQSILHYMGDMQCTVSSGEKVCQEQVHL